MPWDLIRCFSAAESFSNLNTIEVLHNTRAERIRLNGVDCPEKGRARGHKAKQAASTLVFGKEVTLQTHGKDKYGRTIADVLLPDGTNVNHELVKDGWCWWYRKYAPGNSELEKLEKEARDAKKGLWADPSPIPPWVYRKARRGQSLDLSDVVPLQSETEGSTANRPARMTITDSCFSADSPQTLWRSPCSPSACFPLSNPPRCSRCCPARPIHFWAAS